MMWLVLIVETKAFTTRIVELLSAMSIVLCSLISCSGQSPGVSFPVREACESCAGLYPVEENEAVRA
jgi:hypothetical protein